MAGCGKQRKLGPSPESGLCGWQGRSGPRVGVAGRRDQPARSRALGETQRTAPPAGGAPPPTCRRAAAALGSRSPRLPGRPRREGAPGSPEGAEEAGKRRAGARGGRARRRRGVGGRCHVAAIVVVPVYKVPPAGRAPHLANACSEPALPHAPGILRDAPRTDVADMGRAMVTRLGLGLLLLALLLPAQIYSQSPSPSTNSTTTVTPTNSSSSTTATTTSTTASSTNPTNGSDSVLQSISCLFMILFSLLHLYC